MHRLAITLLLFMAGCFETHQCYSNDYARITNYEIKPDVHTAKGIGVDTSGHNVDLEKIDQIFDAVEQCLLEHLPKIAPFCEKKKMECQKVNAKNTREFWTCYDLLVGCENYHRVKSGINRDCIKIKIAPDFRASCGGQYKVFPCRVPEQGCLDKGLMPTPECPCSCRSTIQDSDLITTPDFAVLSGELVRLLTGFNNPWTVDPLKTCLNF